MVLRALLCACLGLLALPVSVLPAASQAPASEGASKSEADARPLHGYFFVGGHYVETGNDRVMAGQMYVEYFRPKAVRHPYPIIMVHGTAQTGTNFIMTPDGRPGWADNFVDQGYAVYVVDQVGRARSGYFPKIYGPAVGFTARFIEQNFTGIEEAQLWPQAKLHTQWPGGAGKAGNPSFDQFLSSQVESIANGPDTENWNAPALVALLEKVGPAIVLTHSQSGVFGWKLGDTRPDLVHAIVAVEPNGPPFYDVDFHGGTEWYTDSPKGGRPWGVTRIPLNFDPPAKDVSELRMVRDEKAASEDQVRCWLQAEPARRLPKMKGIPIAIVTGEASFRATYDRCTSRFLTQAGVANTHILLAAEGVHGNGHMMMLEKNSAEIAGVIARWLGKSVK
jgi:pimeloyl-ACP methyl ester carboxylesterase